MSERIKPEELRKMIKESIVEQPVNELQEGWNLALESLKVQLFPNFSGPYTKEQLMEKIKKGDFE